MWSLFYVLLVGSVEIAIGNNMQMKQIPLTQTLAFPFYEWGRHLGGVIKKPKTKLLNHLSFLKECTIRAYSVKDTSKYRETV